MPVFYLSDELVFPDPNLAEDDGTLAIGGDLSIERLLLAYCNGIFPWPYDEESPLIWASPNPRLILFPEKIKISKNLRKTINKGIFEIKVDQTFTEVILNCAKVKRKKESSTWIIPEIIYAYINLYNHGFAHSFEVFKEGMLVGGLYGVSLGGAFIGESMFHKVTDASKVALYFLVKTVQKWGFDFIDAQIPTNHLLNMGFETIERKEYLCLLDKTLQKVTKTGKWELPENLC